MSASGSVNRGSGWGKGSPRSRFVSAMSASALASKRTGRFEGYTTGDRARKIQHFGMDTVVEEFIQDFIRQHPLSTIEDDID